MKKTLYTMIGGEKSAVFKNTDVCMSEKEFEEAFSDEEFVSELLKLKTGEQVKKALEKKGIFLTPEEFDKFAKVLLEAFEKKKLPENELESCSGGAKDDARVGAEVLARLINHEVLENSDGFFASLIMAGRY